MARLNLDREDTFGLCCQMQTALGAPAEALLFRRVTASLANVPWDDELAHKGSWPLGLAIYSKCGSARVLTSATHKKIK